MLSEAPVPVAVSAVLLLALVIPVAFLMPGWWRGTSSVSPEEPPLGWALSCVLWRHLAYGASVSLPMLGLAAIAVLLSKISLVAADVMLWLVMALAALWVTVAVFARPRFLIPPTWRPERKASAPEE